MIEQPLTQHLLKYRAVYFLLSLAFTFFCGYGLQFFTFDADPNLYFSEDNERLLGHKAIEETYGTVDNILLGVHVKEGNLYTPDNLAVVEAMTEEAWLIPYSQRVDSLANFSYSWSEGDDLIVEELVENAQDFSLEEADRIKHIAMTEPGLLNRLSTQSADIAVINIHITLPYKDRIAEEQEVFDSAQALAKKYEQANPHIDVLVSGNIASNTSVNNKAIEDTKTLIPLMYLIIFGLLGILLRSVSAIFIIGVITAASIVSALGMACHLGVVINLLSITSVNIVITVTIAHCVHLMVYFLQAHREGKSKFDAMSESIRINLQPIFLTSFTTAIGFLSMNLSSMPPAHDLGNITAWGVCVAFIMSLTLLPFLALLLPVKQEITTLDESINIMDKFADFVIKHRYMTLAVSLGTSLLLLGMAPLNEINDRFTENLKKPAQFRLDNEVIDEHFGGLYTLEYDFKAKPGSTISDPEYLNALDGFVNYLRSQPEVSHVHSYTDIIKRLNRNMHSDDETFYTIPQSQDEAAQYLLLFEMSQPFGADMSHYILPDKTATKLLVAFPSLDSSAMRHIRERFDEYVRNEMPTYMYHSGESLSVMWSFIGKEAFLSSLEGSLLALFLISIILSFIFKSIRYGIISLIPNLFPAGVGYGIWSVYSGFLDMSQMMVLSITIGIVVDDTVHFLSKYLRARREHGADATEAVRFAFHNVGKPLWITTVVLVAGFALLMTSSFTPNSNLGTLTAIILVTALALDFFLLPPLLMVLDNKKSSGGKAEAEALATATAS